MKFIFLILMMWFQVVTFLPTSYAQQVEVIASLDSSNIVVGDQISYKLQLIIPENYRFTWPSFNDTLTAHVEIISRSEIDTIALGDGLIELKQDFTITAFDTGYYLIPPVNINYSVPGENEEESVVSSEPFLLNVFSIPVDLSQPIKPIKKPLGVPITFIELLPWLLLVLVIVGIVVFMLTRKKKVKPINIFKPKPKQPPYEKAFEALEQLKKDKLWQQGFIKEYYSKLSGIVREYIEERWEVPAIESTTYETLILMDKKLHHADSLRILRELLDLSDLVKFAKAKPLPSENEKSLANAYEFLRNTKPDQEHLPVPEFSTEVFVENQAEKKL